MAYKRAGKQEVPLLNTLRGHTNDVTSVTYSPSGAFIASGSVDNTVKVWEAHSGACVQTLTGHTECVISVTYSPSGAFIASGSRDKTIKVWDACSGACVQTLTGHTNYVRSVTYSPSGTFIASGSDDNTVKVWEAHSGACVQTLTGHIEWVISVTYSPSGAFIASSSQDKTIKIWDTRSGACVQTLTGHTKGVISVTYSPSGTFIASGSQDKTVKVWDTRSGACVLTLTGHTEGVSSVTYSPSGEFIASSSGDNTVKVWEARSGACMQTLTGHTDIVYSVTYSPSGAFIASGSWDRTVKVWDVRSLQADKVTGLMVPPAPAALPHAFLTPFDASPSACMSLKFIACDLIISKDNKVWVTELCPALSCARSLAVEIIIPMELKICLSLASLSPQGFKMVQAPQEPEPSPLLYSHYQRDKDRPPFSMMKKGVISKEMMRFYLSTILRGNKDTQSALWIMYFRHIANGDTASKFSVLLQKTFQRLKINIPVVESYPLGVACELDKVFFWQLLKLEHSALMIPKEIFRFSTFDGRQKQKIADFLANLSGEKVIIKPTNASLTFGTLVVPKEKVVFVIETIAEAKRKVLLPQDMPLFMRMPSIEPIIKHFMEIIKKSIFPQYIDEADEKIKEIIDLTLEKFVHYWLKINKGEVQGTEYDFFLVEAFKPPRDEMNPGFKHKVSVASRIFFTLPNASTPSDFLPLLIYSKRSYKFSKNSEDDMIGISFCYTSHAIERDLTTKDVFGNMTLSAEWNKQITDYSLRSKKYENEAYSAFKFPREQSWMRKLVTMQIGEFIETVRCANVANRELIEYLTSPVAQDLNFDDTDFCWNCFKISKGMKKCTACKEATYCNEACQRADWEGFHKAECKILKK